MKSIFITVILVTTLCVTAQTKDVYIEVTFKSGIFAGTHKFTPEKGNCMSQVNIKYFEGESNLNASKLVADNDFQIHYISRTFSGEATKGKHNAKSSTTGCGSLNFIDLKNDKPYKRVDGDFTGCNEMIIKEVTNWKQGIVKKRRVITGSFTDTVEFEFTLDDGSKKKETAEVTIKFKANESRMD
ncbi:hypothetical protein [Winogradskyella sp. PG-2]|uniref:hypothetical protein n=1 Tax=Winogradskyella sp. PG-2 TaxID=754409 RepID=UPI0004589979|nr:hypothetical protein [Winogradskyella sp. PG-2]BAO75256.1 hypothetical protein WPG_1026 [Winogradskyella sp. PG-2]